MEPFPLYALGTSRGEPIQTLDIAFVSKRTDDKVDPIRFKRPKRFRNRECRAALPEATCALPAETWLVEST